MHLFGSIPFSPTGSEPEGPHKPKLTSEGASSFNGLFGHGPAESSRLMQHGGSQPGLPQHGSGKDLPEVMRRLSLVGQLSSAEGAFSDDMATLPPRRKLNFFSSLRLRKREASQSQASVTQVDGPDKIRSILANLRNKGQC